MTALPLERSLVVALLRFARFLRVEGFAVTPSRIQDILRGMVFVNVADRGQFFLLLQSNLVSRRQELARFRQLFNLFWAFEGLAGDDQTDGLPLGRPEEKSRVILGLEPPQEGEADSVTLGASLEQVTVKKDFAQLDPWERDMVRARVEIMARLLAARLGRRRRPATRAAHVDFRRSLRRALRTGGELFDLRYKRRRPVVAPIHMLLDVSGSMRVYGHFFLLFMFVLANRLPQARAYVFSTHLTPVSALLRSALFPEAWRRIVGAGANWQGGTDIGRSLAGFVERHLGRQESARNTVIILSDGWDRGKPDVLAQAMTRLRAGSRRLIWLNPLLASPAYEPLCQGMSTALPHLDDFLPFVNLQSLGELCRHLAAA